MEKLNFYAVWSLRDTPRQFSCKSNRRRFQVHVPLPLPKQLVIFGFGDWSCKDTAFSAEVVVSEDVQPQNIGTLSSQIKCLTWEGDWSDDIITVSEERGRRGMYGKIVLKACREDNTSVSSTSLAQRKLQISGPCSVADLSSSIQETLETETQIISESSHMSHSVCYSKFPVIKVETSDFPHPAARPLDNTSVSSTSLAQRKLQISGPCSVADLSSSIQETLETETIISESSHMSHSVCYSKFPVIKVETSDFPHPAARPLDKTPTRTVNNRRARPTWSSDETDSLTEDTDKTPTSKRTKLCSINIREKITEQIKNESREVSACPSKRWSHTLCLSDPDTAVLIGGETSNQNYCEDSLWKLELDSNFWFPMNSSATGPVPPCTRGHTATFDQDSKAVFVYGGLRESQCYSELYILNTLTWKWRLVTVGLFENHCSWTKSIQAKGKVPALSYHSAVFYQKELFVFGGVQPSNGLGDKCSNALYIFNPEYELWYQPIVEGDKPLPRFGHSATLLGQKLVIFGGQMTAAYLNDLHVLDLGLMEYTAVKCANRPPLPRGFHAAAPVLGNRILISGGRSAIGPLQDVHVFNTDTGMWSSVTCPLLCSKPCAGHSMINLQTEQGENRNIKCTVLVFGGSDCSGSFYNDTQIFRLEITDK
ncbi:acyl-CoA-binding domain-containing protein 6 isoform X2 [Xiphophorus couchianus]|uniref:acyl-CoA-binding domain-containing protein 6 isoform X2 n=1 Tax=Xiphophorus couchianus TaxID=32473 RepID=UPI001016A106|nr:acyl-CoA-binding domain-containing protein 6-like isoform X2 [Xiphophorus couchianus]